MSYIKTFCFLICALVTGSNVFGVSYSYDSLNRLTNVDYGNGSVISYTYDAAGNRLTYSGVVSSDTTPPTIAITSPTTGPAYTNSTATINLSGTASDNVGVTLVTWQNYSGGLGVATGTNSWSITGIPLKPGANVISVTAYDAAGNSTPATLTVSFATGGTGTTTSTTNTAFSDNFTGNVINSNVWSWWGSTVIQTNQTMEVMTTVTDKPGTLTNKPFAISSTGLITISRRVFLHLDTPYSYNGGTHFFTGVFAINVPGVPQFGVQYCDYDYSNSSLKPAYGFFIFKNGGSATSIAGQTNVSSGVTALWDTWFNEKIIYDPATGQLQYFINNALQITFNVGAVPTSPPPTMSFYFQAYGWWTTHYQWFQNLLVTQASSSVSGSAPLSQIAGYSRLANGVFRLTMNGPVGSNYVIYASSDLKYWTPLYTNTVPPAGLITFVDPSASGYPQRFYRAVPLGTAVTVVPPPPTPQLTGISVTAGGQFEFYLNGPVGSNYVVQVSSNLVNWVNLETNAIPGGGVNVYDFPIQKTQSQIFYRAVPAP